MFKDFAGGNAEPGAFPCATHPHKEEEEEEEDVSQLLTGHRVSVHVIEHVAEAEDPGGGCGRAAPHQRGAEFLARFARAQLGIRLDRGAHVSRERAHLRRRAAAALQLASVAFHAHLVARMIQRSRSD